VTLGNSGTVFRCSNPIQKSLRFCFLCLLLLASSNVRAQGACDTAKTIGHFQLNFVGASYDYLNGTSSWNYSLTWDGIGSELTKFTIQLCSLVTDSNLLSATPSGASIGTDDETGIYGIMWSSFANFPANTPVSFSFTLNMILGIDHAEFAPTASINSNIATICGPSSTCNVPPRMRISNHDDEVDNDTTVFLCAPEEICIEIHGDDDDHDKIWLNKLAGMGIFQEKHDDSGIIDTVFCFTPDTAGIYCFTFELDDDDSMRGISDDDDDIEEVCVTVIFIAPPTITCPPNVTLECGDPTDPSNTGFATADSTCIQPSSCICNGGIRLLSLRTALPYAGGVVSVEARAAESGMLDSSPWGVDTESFDGTLFTSSTFSGAVAITRMEAVGTDVVVTYTVDVGLISLTKMNSNSEFRVTAPGGTNQQAIHTSCSQPIAPPFDFGVFSIVGLIDRSGSECNLDSTNCSIPDITFVDDTTSARCPLIISRTWIATDSCGNADSCVQIITVQDTTAPSITAPADIVFDCVLGDAGTPTDTSDNCFISSVSFSDDTTSLRCPLSITRTWTATDSCGNSASDVQIITVQDTTAPSITELLWQIKVKNSGQFAINRPGNSMLNDKIR